MENEQTLFRRWPTDASTDYIAARRDLLEAEIKLREQVNRVAAMRHNLPPGATLPAYTFEEASVGESRPGRKVTLQELVQERSLVVKHLMLNEGDEQGCPSCSMWLDGYNGVAQHLAQNVDFVVIAPAPAEELQAWGRRRGWTKLRLLSSDGSTFNADLNLANPAWNQGLKQVSAVSVFRRDGDVVRHVYSCTPDFTPGNVGGMDLLSPVWNVLDLVPEGRADWNPSNEYVREAEVV